MVSGSVPGVHSWGNRHYASVLGALGLSPCHEDSLGAALFLRPWGCWYGAPHEAASVDFSLLAAPKSECIRLAQ
jgi:hypothetical protein